MRYRLTNRLAAASVAAVTVGGLVGVAAASGPAFASTPAASAAPIPTSSGTYSGDAYAIGLKGVKVLGTAVNDGTLGDSGQLPTSGGKVTGAPGTIHLPGGLGTITVTEDQATGVNGLASANSRILGLSLLNNLGTSTLTGALGTGALSQLTSTLSNLLGGGLLGSTTLGLPVKAASVKASSPKLLSLGGSGSSLLGGLLGGSGGLGGILGGGSLSGLIGALTGTPSSPTSPSLGLGSILPSVLQVGLVNSASTVTGATTGTTGAATAHTNAASVGTISLLGGAVTIPINPKP
ncbi:MAG: hypothetical protein ACRD0J_05135, partial [Acidimicrobiales bacterium]